MWCAACRYLLALVLAAASPAADSPPPNDSLQLECRAPDALRGTFSCTAHLQRPVQAPKRPVELRLQLSCCYLPVGQSADLKLDDRERAFTWTGNPEPGTQRHFDIELRSAYNTASAEREIVATLRGVDGGPVARERVVPAQVRGHTDLLDLRLPLPAPVVLGTLLVVDVVLVVAALRAHPQDRALWFMLQYERNGEPQIAQGYEGAGLFYESDDAERLAALTSGQRLPCWVDPLRPDRAILDRGPHGGAVVALLVLIGLWRSLRRLWRPQQGE